MLNMYSDLGRRHPQGAHSELNARVYFILYWARILYTYPERGRHRLQASGTCSRRAAYACLFARPPACLSIPLCLPICLPACLPACLSHYACLSVCLSARPPACPPGYPVPIHPSHPSIHPSASPSIHLSILLPIKRDHADPVYTSISLSAPL